MSKAVLGGGLKARKEFLLPPMSPRSLFFIHFITLYEAKHTGRASSINCVAPERWSAIKLHAAESHKVSRTINFNSKLCDDVIDPRRPFSSSTHRPRQTVEVEKKKKGTERIIKYQQKVVKSRRAEPSTRAKVKKKLNFFYLTFRLFPSRENSGLGNRKSRKFSTISAALMFHPRVTEWRE